MLTDLLISKILDIAKGFIPDTSKQKELETKIKELDIEELKEKGNYIDKIHSLIPFVLPGFLLVLLSMFTLNYLSDFINSNIGRECPIIHIDDRLVEICKTFIAFLFGKKTIEKFAKK